MARRRRAHHSALRPHRQTDGGHLPSLRSLLLGWAARSWMPGLVEGPAAGMGEAGEAEGAGETGKLVLLPTNPQVRELQTLVRDKGTEQSEFVFYADRLIRHVVEEGLNQLPFDEATVRTPTGQPFHGIRFRKGNCGVSISRGGEAMEKGLRDCCRSIRIGKILVEKEPETGAPQLLYARLTPDVAERRILLLYPILSTGQTAAKALDVLRDNGVREEKVVLVSLFATPTALEALRKAAPRITVVTSELSPLIPNHFGTKYFGTD